MQIDGAVQAAGELKVTFKQRSGRSELIDDFFSVQILTSISVLSMLQSEPECRLIRI